MRFFITNAFSLNMLEREGQDIAVVPIDRTAAASLVRNEHAESAIGHADTARLVGLDLGLEIAPSRINVRLVKGETSLVVAQYTGPRLPEGAVELPAGASIQYWQVYHIM